jgi:hypothetical protein
MKKTDASTSSYVDQDGDKKPKKSEPLVITFGSKAGHKWAHYNKGPDCIYINDRCPSRVHLAVGCRYVFDVRKQRGTRHRFMLTESSVGGPDAKPLSGCFTPTAEGIVDFVVTNDTPSTFYYQCQDSGMMGGLIMIKKKKLTV